LFISGSALLTHSVVKKHIDIALKQVELLARLDVTVGYLQPRRVSIEAIERSIQRLPVRDKVSRLRGPMMHNRRLQVIVVQMQIVCHIFRLLLSVIDSLIHQTSGAAAAPISTNEATDANLSQRKRVELTEIAQIVTLFPQVGVIGVAVAIIVDFDLQRKLHVVHMLDHRIFGVRPAIALNLQTQTLG